MSRSRDSRTRDRSATPSAAQCDDYATLSTHIDSFRRFCRRWNTESVRYSVRNKNSLTVYDCNSENVWNGGQTLLMCLSKLALLQCITELKKLYNKINRKYGYSIDYNEVADRVFNQYNRSVNLLDYNQSNISPKIINYNLSGFGFCWFIVSRVLFVKNCLQS